MKNLTLLSIVMLVAIALFSVGASAQLAVTGTTLGSDSTKAGQNVTGTITLTNNGNVTINNIALSSTAASKYFIGFTGAPTSLAAGASATISISGFLSKDLDAVDTSFNPLQQNVGNVVATGTGSATASAPILMQIRNVLHIKKVVVTVNGQDDKSLNDGDTIKALKPGDSLTIKVEVENQFSTSSSEDRDLENVRVTLDSENDIDLSDTEQTIDSISADSTEDQTFDATVTDAASGTYRLQVTADGNGQSPFTGRYAERIVVFLKVERESHELAIRSASISPSILACGATRNVDAKAHIVNTGKSNENDVSVELAIPALGISVRKDAIKLDKSDETTRTISATLPDSVKPGTYEADIVTYFAGTSESDRKALTLKVEDCAAPATTPTPVVTQPTTPTTPPVTATPPTVVSSTKASATSSFWDSGAGIATLVIGILVAVAVIVLLVTMITRKPTAE
jgi:uncharacterized membrane protein